MNSGMRLDSQACSLTLVAHPLAPRMNPSNLSAPDLGPLSPWAPELAQAFVTLASDIALVMDEQGVIRTVAQGRHGSDEAMLPGARSWVGRRWVDTVSPDTRAKVDQLLTEVARTGLARRRELSHPLDEGASVAVAYTAVRLGQDGPVLAVGRDLRAIGAIQQRFLEAQRDMERGYWQARQAEARHRLLHQVASDAVLLIDAAERRITEANAAAIDLFGTPAEHLVGHALSGFLLQTHRQAFDDLAVTVLHTAQAAEIRIRLINHSTPASLALTPLPGEGRALLLARVRLAEQPGTAAQLHQTLARLGDGAAEAVLVTDSAGHALMANAALLRLLNLGDERDVKGRHLADWFEVAGGGLDALIRRVRRSGMAVREPARLLAADARALPVELSASLLSEGDMECIGWSVGRLGPAGAASGEALQSALTALAGQVGELPLPELMREAASLIERHFIGLALERAHEDPAAAARLLGVSEQRIGGLPGGVPPLPETP